MPTEGKCKNAGQNPAVLFMKGLAYPWLWVGKQVHVVKQETIDDFYLLAHLGSSGLQRSRLQRLQQGH